MLTGDEIAFLRDRLDEDERYARMALTEKPDNSNGAWIMDGKLAIRPSAMPDGLTLHVVRNDPARALREVAVWRRLLLEYQIPPGTDAAYGGTERETGFRLALSAALRAKIATYDGNPVTGEPHPSGQTRG